MTDDEEFFAWLDGELDAKAALRVEARVAADPALQRVADKHRRLASGLRAAFAPIATGAVPAALAEAARAGPAKVVSLAGWRDRRRPPGWMPGWVQAGSIAASLALGLVAGAQLLAGSSPVVEHDGRLVAAANLDQALSVQLASAPVDGQPRIGLTFRDRSGALCRSFSDNSASGLACRRDGRWQIRGLFQNGAAETGEYRMAAGGHPQLMALVEAEMAGEPLDSAGEAAALARVGD